MLGLSELKTGLRFANFWGNYTIYTPVIVVIWIVSSLTYLIGMDCLLYRCDVIGHSLFFRVVLGAFKLLSCW